MSKRRSSKNGNTSNLMTVSEFEKTYGTGSGTGSGNGSGFAGNKLLTVAEFEEQQRNYNAERQRNQQRMAAEEQRRQREQQYQQAVKKYTQDYNNLMLSNNGILQPVKSGEKVSMSDFMNPFQRRSEYKKSAVKAGLWTQEEYDADKQEQEARTANMKLAQSPIYNKYFNQDELMQSQNGISMEDPRKLAEFYWTTKGNGAQKTTNPLNMGGQQLLDYLSTAEQNYNNATAKENEHANWTQEEKDEAYQDTLLKGEGKTIFYQLSTRGLPVREEHGVQYVPDVELWNGMGDSEFIRTRPDDGGDYLERTKNDRLLYDAIYGNGAYDERVDAAKDDAELDELDAEMDELWQRLENGNFVEEYDALDEAYNESHKNEGSWFDTNVYQRQMELGKQEQERAAKLAELTAAAPEGEGAYDESKVLWGLNQSAVDQVYYYANRQLDGSDFSNYGNMRPASFMTADQLDVFNRYYISGDKEGAKAYYDALEPYLKQIQTIYKSYLEDKMSRNEYAPLMIANRVLTQPFGAIPATAGTMLALFGNEDAQDPNSGWYSLAQTNQNIQNARADVWGKQAAAWFGDDAEVWGQRLNGLLYSLADNLYAMALTGGAAGVNAEGWAGKTAETMLQFIMSSEATASTMLERIDAGYEPTEAALFSLGSGAIEWITEKVSIEALLKPDVKELLGKPKELMKYLLKNTAAEGSEEVASDLLGTTLDFVLSRMYGHETELEAQVSELKAGNPGMSDDEAWKQVLMNYAGELAVSGGMGGLSGLLMSGGRGMLTRFQVGSQNRAAGSNILNYGTDASMNAEQTAAKTQENLNGMIDAASKFEPGTEVREKADELLEDLKKAKKPDPKKVGSLYRSLMEQSNEKVQGIVSTIMGDVFADRLTELGETEENIPNLQEALVNLVSGKESAADLKTISKSESALKILSEYRMDDGKIGKAKEETKTEIKPFQSMQENMSAMATEPQTAEKAIRETEEKMEGWKTAEKAQVLMAGGKMTGMTAMVDGNAAEVTGVTRTEDGGLQVNFANGESAAASEVRAVGEGMARTLQYLNNDQGRTVGLNLANAMLQIGSKTKNTAKAVTDAMSIMYSETLGIPGGKTSLSSKEEAAIREAVQKDIEESEVKRTKNSRKINLGQGKTTYNGAEYGSDRFRNALKGLDSSIRNEAMAIASIAKSAGFDVELYYDKSDTANQGSFSTGGGIRINLAGEFNTEGVRRSALATMSHEVTHWLEANSKDSYKALRSFVVSNLQKSGVNVRAELNNIIETYGAHGVDLDLSGAVAEMVAKGCEQVLTNENVVRQLKEQDPALHGKIREAVRKVVSRIRNALADATNTSSRYAKQLMKYADQLSKVWLEAYNEALGAKGTGAAEGKTIDNETIQNSMREYEENAEKRDKYYFDNILNEHPTIKVTVIQNPITVPKTNTGLIDTAKVVQAAKQNKYAKVFNNNGKMTDRYYAYIRDLGIYAEMPTIGIRHNFTRNAQEQKNNIDNAMLAQYAPEIMLNAVEVNRGKKDLQKNKYEHILVAPVRVIQNGITQDYAVRFVVNHPKVNQPAMVNMEIVGTLHNINEKKATLTSFNGSNAKGRHVMPSMSMSLSDFFNDVKNNMDDTFTEAVYNKAGMQRNNKAFGKNLQYSIQEQDEQYMAAVESGDTDAAMKILVKEAKKNGYDTKHVAFHGSDDLGFTVFDMDLSQGQIFIAYNKELAGTYTNRPEIREIRSIDKNAKSYLHMTGEEIAKAYTESNMRGDARYISKEEISALIKEKEDNYLALFDKDGEEEVSFKGKTYKNAYELAKQLVEMGSDPKRAGDPVYHEYLQGVARKYGKKDPNENIFNSYNFEYKRTEIADEFFKVAGVNKNDTFKKGIISISFAPGRESYFPVSTVKKQMQNNYGENRGIYAFFTKPGKQLVVDANRSNWNSISWNAVRRAADNFDEEEFRNSDYRDKVTAKTREVAKWAKDHGYDSVRINNVYDNGGRGSGNGYGDIGIFFKESDVKSADPVTYDEAGEIILPSERYNDQNKDIRYSIQEQDEQYDEAVKAGDMETARRMVEESALENGYRITAFHGTGRADRVGTVFRPERATSGPMAFFTDTRKIAEGYARDKVDTSIAYDEEYGDYFTQFRGTSRNGKSVPVGDLWKEMTFAERRKVTEAAKHVAWDEEAENIIYDPNMDSGNGGFNEWTLRDNKGNAINALVDAWLQSGDLYNQEERFLEVLKLAGIENVKWNNPDAREEKVYDVYLKIQNPFNTKENFNHKFLDELEAWWDEQDQGKYDGIDKSNSADLWDKHSRTLERWIELARDNVDEGYSSVWTSIPDAVTDFLKSKNYDGIQDVGGKNGGIGHTVWIPFASEQVKSADAVTYNNDGEMIPLSERFRTDNEEEWKNKDIRYSIQEDDAEGQRLEKAYREAYDKYTDKRLEISRLKGELDDLNKRIAATKPEDMDKMYQEAVEWEEKTGYGKLANELKTLEEEERKARKALDEYTEKRGVAEEQQKIKESGLSEAEWRRKQAVKVFGYTGDFREAGYLLPNGRLLNFCGDKGQHYGVRGNDHRNIGQVYASGEMQGSAAMYAFMKDGNIRVMAESPGIDISTAVEPTSAQYTAIRNMAARFADEEYFNVDLSDERGNTVGSLEYEGRINPARIVNDIKTYFKTGVIREQSMVSMFHGGQFSFMDETDVDARAWMETVQESSLQTEAEKSLLRNFKALRMRVSLKQEQERKYRGEIARLEAIPEAERTREQKSKLAGYKVRLENATKIKQQAEEELAKITSSNGYVSMMYRQQRVLNDFVYGRTQEEVRSAVERLERSAATIEERIRANREAAEALEKSGIVDRFRKLLGTTTADQTAAELKKAFNSTWTKGQIRTYLDPIITKMMAGEDFQQDVEELAGILVNSDSTNAYEELSGLRGLTITIGKGALAELRAQNSSLKEVRARLAGTGITVKSGERSTLEADIEDLRAEYPSIPELGDEKDALGNFLDWVDGMKAASAANEFYEQRIAEAMAVITGKAAGAAKGIYMPNDSKAQKQVLAMMDFVKSLNAETAKAQQDLQNIADELAAMRKAGQQASGMANTMAHDANVALDYFNKMARIAEDTAKQKTRKDLIEQLKSDHAKKIAKNNEEWRALIERDRDARKQLETNRAYKNRINTVLKRAYNRLKNPKGLQNIPEYMQGLARELIGIFVDNDMADGTRFTTMSRDSLAETRRILDAWEKESGAFDLSDLRQAEEAVELTINQDLMTIYDGITAINSEIRGKNKAEILQKRGEILKGMQEAVSEIWSAIMTENTIQIRDRRIAVETAAYNVATGIGNRRAKEWTGKAGGMMRTLHKAIISGNMTPEYFFRTLGNKGLNDLWEGYHEAENRNGLELAKAKARMGEIAKKHGYSTWDVNQKVTLDLTSGAQVQMTIGQLMSLYATWKRETALGPEVSEHLAGGGFYAEQDLQEGILGKTTVDKKAHRIAVERNEKGEIVASPDMMRVEGLLTEEQKQFVDEMVGFMSSDMSELGNEASMKAYGIRLYKEGYYFPFQMWDGVRSRKSNDSGSAAAAQDRAFHPSFSKSRMHGANNALVIGDFMQTVSDHVAGMINYATMGLANENLQKALNFQLSEYSEEETNKRNVWAMIEEAYGREAAQYLRELQVQLNGGAVRTTKNIGDKLISLFRKNAVAGSLSVAAQQPMSYIRAAVLINPKYLAAAMNPATWKGSYKEMMEHSGVAVIKDMGRFDMNFGQSAREYLMPEALEGKTSKTWEFIKDKATILPELMDRMTWTRMWSACKAEMKALHPEMDVKSDEFLDMVGERFNELMRRTQVYDSVLVKSANMRNQNPGVKMITSFMAEPTLTANVLADAVRSAVRKEKGGKLLLARAGATFILSAVMQAAIKGAFGAGRNPDESKNEWENFLYRFWSNLFGEIDPLTLVPGYSTAIDLLKGSDISDNALGMVGKIFDAGKTGVDALLGTKSKGAWRDVEDSVGQLMQIFTGLPAKNLMRDARAMYNFVAGKFESTSPYAWRPTNTNITGNQFMEKLMTADNLLGVVNQWLGDAGYATDNNAYYKRIYDAKKAGDEKTAENLIDYLLTGGKVKKRETIDSKVAAMAKDDAEMSAEDTAEFLIGEGANAETYIKDQLKQGKMSAEDARKMLKKADPEKTDDDVWWTVDRIEYQLETGAEKALSGNTYYYRLTDAVNNNSANEIQTAVKSLLAHGITKERIKDKLSDWKSEYLSADSNGKRRIRDAMQKAYKALGLPTADADKTIEKWEKDAKKKKN